MALLWKGDGGRTRRGGGDSCKRGEEASRIASRGIRGELEGKFDGKRGDRGEDGSLIRKLCDP